MITLNTAIVGVNNVSGRTELANGLMIFHDTGSVARADLAFTRVLALQVDAGLGAGAAAVLQADGDGGVAARGADADRLVVQHLALLALAAQPRPVARVDAAAGLAALVTGTLLTGAALHLAAGAREHARLVHHEAVLALAGGLVAGHLAHLVLVAAEPGAGVVALLGLPAAGLAQGAALVAGAALHYAGLGAGVPAPGVGSAGHQGLADVALRTLAPRLVQHHRADRVLATRRAEAARVQAAASAARLGGRAVEISATFSI